MLGLGAEFGDSPLSCRSCAHLYYVTSYQIVVDCGGRSSSRACIDALSGFCDLGRSQNQSSSGYPACAPGCLVLVLVGDKPSPACAHHNGSLFGRDPARGPLP